MSTAGQSESPSTRSTMQQLGYAGVLPFLALAITVHVAGDSASARALASLQHYAAVILTFVGAVHWGRALREPAEPGRLYWAVTPSLIGWVALSLPLHAAMAILIGAFLLCWWVDRAIYASASFGGWYMRMRTHLTLCVVAGLLIGWLGA